MLLLNGLPDSCSGCQLSTNPHCGYFTKVSGKGTSGVMIIGEASGEHEAKEGRPFIEHAPAGSILEKAIRMQGGSRDDYWITNIVRCRPPNNILAGAEYEREAIDHCNNYLLKAISELRPRAILSLGALPTRELTGFSEGKRTISYVRGYPLPGPSGIVTIPSYHPAFITRGNTRLLGLLIKDLISARSAANGRLNFVIDPSIEMRAEEGVKALENLYKLCLEDPECWIAYDIETEESQKGGEDEIVEFGEEETTRSMSPDLEEVDEGEQAPSDSLSDGTYRSPKLDSSFGPILSIQFAISDQWGVYGDWSDPKIQEVAQKILALPNPKVAHNGDHFDRPKLEKEGIRINGDHYDSLSMRKALQPDLPAGLQQVAVDYGWRWPWKHYSGSNSILYGVADVCSLVRIVSKLPGELDRLGMWEGYQKYIRGTREIVEIPWESRGIPMSNSRLDEFREYLTREVLVKNIEVKSHIPDELHSKHPKDGYKNVPDSVKSIVLEDPVTGELLTKPTEKVLKNGTIKLVKSKIKISDIYKMLMSMQLPELLDKILVTHPELMVGDFDGQWRLFERIWFNPRSSQQMIKYLKFKGIEVPLTFKEGKETTSDKLMGRLQKKTGDPVIALSREIRSLEKMRDSYTGKLGEDGVARGGWIPDSDGRLRAAVKTNSTWQFSSLDPNVFTLPKRREELAERFRKCVMAETGHRLVEFDFKSFHSLTTAALATDDVMWRVAKIDHHSYTTAWLVKDDRAPQVLKWSDSALKEYLDEIKDRYPKIRNEQAKPLNHGTNFGQGYKRLYFENEEYFQSESQAKQMLLMLRRIYPKTFKWQEELLESLDVGGGRVPYLQSVWGGRRWFWDVWSWKKNFRGEWYKSKGQDAEKALAYYPSTNAHGMFRQKLLLAAERGWLTKYELILFPHDAWVFHPPISLADECIENIKGLMEAPVIELANPILCPEGFSCAVDVAIGPSMGEMKEVK